MVIFFSRHFKRFSLWDCRECRRYKFAGYKKLISIKVKKFSNIFIVFHRKMMILSFLMNVLWFVGFEEKSIWSLKKGKRKGTDEQVSIFAFEIKNGTESKLELAKASLKRIKTLRHPSILQFLDSFENDKVIYVATEYVETLGFHLDKLDGNKKDVYLAWGIFQITVSRHIIYLILWPD